MRRSALAQAFGAALVLGCVVAHPTTESGTGRTQEPRGLDGWLETLRAEPDPTRIAERIERAIRDHGGTPLITDLSVLFLVEHPSATSARLLGDFNEWGQEDSSFAGGSAMERIGSTNWFALHMEALPHARFEYVFQLDSDRQLDNRNPRRVTTFGAEHSEVALPGARLDPGLERGAEVLDGRLESFPFESAIRGNTRPISVYLPPGYDVTSRSYPALFVLDGDSWLETARLDSTLDALIARGELPALIAVFVGPVNRGLEYGTSSKFRRMMIEELVPLVETEYRLSPEPGDRALLGVSRGGLAALDLGTQHPKAFGFVAVAAPALRPLPFLKELEARPAPPVRFALLDCLYDVAALRDQALELRRVLLAKGCALHYVTAPIGHSYHGWRHHVDLMLMPWLRKGERSKD